MNILNDFIIRVDTAVPETGKEQEIANLTSIINEKDALIAKYTAELERLNSGIIEQEIAQPRTSPEKTKAARKGRLSGKTKEPVSLASLLPKSGASKVTRKKSTKKSKPAEE
jgi:hypothetical protein